MPRPTTAASKVPAPAPTKAGATFGGMAWMVGCTLATALLFATVREAAAYAHPFVVAFASTLFAVLLFAPAVIAKRLKPLVTQRLRLHALRAALNASSVLVFFVALTLTPLAKAVALKFSAPLFATVLAVVVLGEAIRARRIAALVVGFAGTLVVLRPGAAALDLGAVLVLVSAGLWATSMIVIKILSRTDSSLTISLYVQALSLPFLLVAASLYWQMPSWPLVGWCLVAAILQNAVQISFVQAFKEAEVTAVLPLDFLKLIWAAAIGYVAFAEVPDTWTWVGGAMISAAVSYIALRERRTGRGDAGQGIAAAAAP